MSDLYKNTLKFTLACAALICAPTLFAQIGMGNFMSDLSGVPDPGSGGGSGVPIDGGISAMIAGSVYYGYKQMKKKRNSVK